MVSPSCRYKKATVATYLTIQSLPPSQAIHSRHTVTCVPVVSLVQPGRRAKSNRITSRKRSCKYLMFTPSLTIRNANALSPFSYKYLLDIFHYKKQVAATGNEIFVEKRPQQRLLSSYLLVRYVLTLTRARSYAALAIPLYKYHATYDHRRSYHSIFALPLHRFERTRDSFQPCSTSPGKSACSVLEETWELQSPSLLVMPNDLYVWEAQNGLSMW